MTGGKITVKGDTTKPIGMGMKGGEIHVDGNFYIHESMLKGKVYSNGIIIMEK